MGHALNPAIVEGQLHGGSVQSIGRALAEELVHDEQGQLLTGTLMDYALPKASMLPDLDVSWVEVPAPEGPFGAKGMGEAPMLPGPGGDRQRDRGGLGSAVAGAPDDGEAGLGGVPIRRGRVTTGVR